MPTPLLLLTIGHTLLSLLMLAGGVVLLLRLARGGSGAGLDTPVILLSVATILSGFLFPFVQFLPSHAVGVLSVLVFAAVIWARYAARLAGAARWVYGAGLTLGIYLDAFVAVVQAFLKIPPLREIAPTQQSPGFVIAQLVVLAAFAVLGFAVVRGLRRSVPAASGASAAQLA